MNFFPHAKSATFAKDFSDQKITPFRPLRPLRPLREQSVPQSPLTNLPFRPAFAPRTRVGAWRPLRESSAFSLTEVVIAMGVAAVAFTSIIALFPLGLNMSKESYEATQAALIAQTILADLKDALNTGSGKNQALKLIPKAGNTETFDSNNYTTIDLYNNSSKTFYLAYDQKSRSGATGSPIILRPCAFSTSPGEFYTDGSTNGANIVVRVIVEKTLVLGASSRSNPQKIEVSVETPGNSKNTNRVQYVFTGVINQS